MRGSRITPALPRPATGANDLPKQFTLCAEEVRALFDYDPETGVLSWKERASSNTWAGKPAASHEKHGYYGVRIAGRAYRVHRIIWLHYYGEIPTQHIDHIDCNKSNNSIENLRQCTRSQNLANVDWKRPNSTGFRGVTKVGKKYRAKIHCQGKYICLGLHDSPHNAHVAYKAAAKSLFGKFARV